MRIYNLSDRKNGICEINELPDGAVMILGFFDGVHRGHKALINASKEYARWMKAPVCVWTFQSLPKADRFINTPDEKLSALSSVGVDYAVVEEFDDVRDLSPDDFFRDYLIGNFSPRAVYCGFNFRYGKDAAGTSETLSQSARESGIPVFVLPPYEIGNSVVSSSSIRSLIQSGKVDEAAALLSRPYSITSDVLHGNELGRAIGFPTINQRIGENKIVPRHGVYACTVTVDGETYDGITNLGSRPTVNDDEGDITLETHIFGYSGDVYGKPATVSLQKMLRDEKKFSSVDELSAQIGKDISAAEEHFRQTKRFNQR